MKMLGYLTEAFMIVTATFGVCIGIDVFLIPCQGDFKLWMGPNGDCQSLAFSLWLISGLIIALLIAIKRLKE